MLLIYGLFASLLAHLGMCAPIPYVQDAIWNLSHPYIVIAVAMTNNGQRNGSNWAHLCCVEAAAFPEDSSTLM